MEDSDLRPPATGGDPPVSGAPWATAAALTTPRKRIVVGSIVGLLLLGAFLYHFTGRDNAIDSASRNQASEAPKVVTAPRPLNSVDPSRETAASKTPLPGQSRSSERVLTPLSSPQQSSAPAAPPSPVEDPTLVPRAVATSRVVRSDDQLRVTANARPANQAGVPNTSPMTDRATALPSDDEVLVVQRSGANIRTEPSRTGRVIGTAAKGSKVKVISRSRNWIEVEVGAGRGWISGSLLGPPGGQ
jgi:uncharacterized protein YgiM (DUF1202 family)